MFTGWASWLTCTVATSTFPHRLWVCILPSCIWSVPPTSSYYPIRVSCRCSPQLTSWATQGACSHSTIRVRRSWSWWCESGVFEKMSTYLWSSSWPLRRALSCRLIQTAPRRRSCYTRSQNSGTTVLLCIRCNILPLPHRGPQPFSWASHFLTWGSPAAFAILWR